jgi:hypothetical protein
MRRWGDFAEADLLEGILFTTYATLRTQAKGDKASRLQQIVEAARRLFHAGRLVPGTQAENVNPIEANRTGANLRIIA